MITSNPACGGQIGRQIHVLGGGRRPEALAVIGGLPSSKAAAAAGETDADALGVDERPGGRSGEGGWVGTERALYPPVMVVLVIVHWWKAIRRSHCRLSNFNGIVGCFGLVATKLTGLAKSIYPCPLHSCFSPIGRHSSCLANKVNVYVI